MALRRLQADVAWSHTVLADHDLAARIKSATAVVRELSPRKLTSPAPLLERDQFLKGVGLRPPHQKRDTKSTPRRQEAGTALPSPNSAHRDQATSAKCRGAAQFERSSHIGWRRPDWLGLPGLNSPPKLFAL